MAGNKPSVTAWKTAAAVDTAPMIDTDGDYLNVLRRLAARYQAKAEKVVEKLAEYTDCPPVTDFGKKRREGLVEAARSYYASARGVRALFPEDFTTSEAFPEDEPGFAA